MDNSKWMNYVAVNCHKDYEVEVFEDAKDATHVECDFFFAKGVSLMYAFQDEETMCNTLKNKRLAVFDYTFSKEEKMLKEEIEKLKETVGRYTEPYEIGSIEGEARDPYGGLVRTE